MSVFSEFQKMWTQKFPESSLSSAWENDVRVSLARHRDKIEELTKELEQENLYCMYLEKLLSDVAKIKEAGGDPASLLDPAALRRASMDLESPATTTMGGEVCANNSFLLFFAACLLRVFVWPAKKICVVCIGCNI